MYIGMLWFDNDKNTSVEDKIRRATAYYHNKYARNPNVVFVHPTTFAMLQKDQVNGVEVVPNRSVMPDHYWIGMREAK